MEVKEALRSLIKEWIVPELEKIHLENAELRSKMDMTNKRLDDLFQVLVDQSRRIDDTNKRIDQVRTELTGRIDMVRTDLTERIDMVRTELTERIDQVRTDLTLRMDETNKRIDGLQQVIVGRTEHAVLRQQVQTLEMRMNKYEYQRAA
ncbi:hypothetical protein SAMN06295888_10124 [Desulfonatronum zhilinae]|nr:hypothetical protein SAMN06295888_10124 [Desulfonatronum zhilinae]